MGITVGKNKRITNHVEINSQVSIKHCSLCPGYTEYYCHNCEGDLCGPCKEMHVDILDIKYHKVTVYRGTRKLSIRSWMCSEHPDQVIQMYCKHCDLPVCLHCTQHSQHKQKNIRRAYKNKLSQIKSILISINSDTLYSRQALLNKLKSDFTTFHKEIVKLKTAMVSMSKRLIKSLDNVQGELSQESKAVLICRFLRQNIKLTRYIARIHKYEHYYGNSANKSVQFLRFIKTVRLPQIHDTPRLTQHYLLILNQEINMDGLTKLLSGIKITERGIRTPRAEQAPQMTLMPSPVLQKFVKVMRDFHCWHISCLTPDHVWVSDVNALILKDTATGYKIHSLKDSLVSDTGKHTVTSDRELIYIDHHSNVNKLSNDMKTTTKLIYNADPVWEPTCVYWSPSSRDLLVGMKKYDTYTTTGKVMRYNNSGTNTQIIPHNKSDNLYRHPRFITENDNGDVVVSDGTHYAVVVTSRKGIHRFSYKGPPPSESGLFPHGVCTDALSHILVCDLTSHTIHMLSQDGEFLKYLLTVQSSDIAYPCGISYDRYTHCLWVGLATKSPWHGKTLSVYRHINRHPAILGSSEYPKTYF